MCCSWAFSCSRRLAQTVTSGTVITNTILFGHGSGNLIIAAALLTGRCAADWASVEWKETQSGYNAARLGDYAASFCAQQPTWMYPTQTQLQADWNMCNGNAVQPGWRSMVRRAPLAWSYKLASHETW